ncbi:hypothetical protein V490_02731 [Pseudogymnoascus sp. VKM F-3557]|nr:hypothetical protein V490_02731 [Pseudogymnoascus sp. VKM F-3557]
MGLLGKAALIGAGVYAVKHIKEKKEQKKASAQYEQQQQQGQFPQGQQQHQGQFPQGQQYQQGQQSLQQGQQYYPPLSQGGHQQYAPHGEKAGPPAQSVGGRGHSPSVSCLVALGRGKRVVEVDNAGWAISGDRSHPCAESQTALTAHRVPGLLAPDPAPDTGGLAGRSEP